MTKIEAFQRAAAELGDAGPDEMVSYIASKFGVLIAPQYIPLYRATLRFQKPHTEPAKSTESPCIQPLDR